jgi:hypothetical protein
MRTFPRGGKPNARLDCETLEDRVTPAVAYALGAGGADLLAFDTTNPAVATTAAIAGVAAGDVLVGIDFRPQNGVLYGLGVNGTTGDGTLYAISTQTGFAAAVGAVGSVNPTAALPNPATAGVGYGFDFNPMADRVRVVTTAGQSFVVDPNTGLVTTNSPTLNGPAATADAAAYSNSFPDATTTLLYVLDSTTGTLYLQNTATSTLTPVGPPGPTFTAVNGFDITAGNVAFAALTVNGNTGLYNIDLTTGAATLLAPVAAGPLQGFAVQSDLGGFPAVALNAAGTQLLRFNTATTNTVVTANVAGVNASEVLVGIDYRPQTGQLFGLGVNAPANTATLYRIDPQTGQATAVGATGQVKFVQADGVTAVDLPDTAVAGYGFDFDPTVDKVRVATSTGLNFRVDPSTGAPVDGNLNTSPAPPGTNTDANINGAGSTGVSATAYTNNFGRDLAAPAGATTQYALDAATDTLFVQNTPGSGTQTTGVVVTLAGAVLDFTSVDGFDIPAARVSTSGAVATGFGYAALTVGGVTRAYRINLATAVAETFGQIGTGVTPVGGLAVGAAPAGTINFQSATFAGSETGGTVAVTLLRTGGAAGALAVTLNVTGGSATAVADFTPGPYTVTFPDGATQATLNIPIVNDRVQDPDETFTLALSGATAGAVGAQATATVTIADDDTSELFGFAVGSAVAPLVAVYDTTGAVGRVLNPYPGLPGGVRVALGDVNNDGAADLVTVPAASAPLVNVYDGQSGNLIASFLAYPAGLGAASLAVGDVNGDGFADIIVGTATNFGAVFVYSGKDFSLMNSGLAFGVVLPFGINVAAGDTDGDGKAEIIFGFSGGAPVVGVLNGQTLGLLSIFAPFGALSAGATVAAGDTDGDGKAEIFMGLTGSLALVGTLNGQTGGLLSLAAPLGALPVGLNVASADVNGDNKADLIAGTASQFSLGLALRGTDLAVLNYLLPFGTLPGGVYVG